MNKLPYTTDRCAYGDCKEKAEVQVPYMQAFGLSLFVSMCPVHAAEFILEEENKAKEQNE